MRRSTKYLLTLLTTAIGGCMNGEPAPMPPAAPAATVIGAAQSCIPLVNIRETRVRDDSTIDFIGSNRVWRNTLPSSCPSLKSENRFSYATSLSQLCSTDIIYVLQQYGGSLQRGAGCGLGQFVPVTLSRK